MRECGYRSCSEAAAKKRIKIGKIEIHSSCELREKERENG